MDSTLKLSNNVLAFSDAGGGDNPTRRQVDWSVRRTVAVKNVKADSYPLAPGATLQLFSGVRATSLDNTTELQLTASPLSSSRYRFTWTTVGTAPAFRTARALTLSTHVQTLVANSNQTLTWSSATPGDFAAVQVGDTLLVPDITTGDAATPFNPLNSGYWVVLSKDGTSTTLQLARPSGSGFIGYSEAVTPATNAQVLAYSVAGVQVGDAVTIQGGFSLAVQATYSVVAVTAQWFEVVATQPLPVTETATPGTAGIAFYTSSKRYCRIETDQSVVLRYNGDTGNTNRVDPISPADPELSGWDEKWGPCWSAVVVNLSTSPANVYFVSAE